MKIDHEQAAREQPIHGSGVRQPMGGFAFLLIGGQSYSASEVIAALATPSPDAEKEDARQAWTCFHCGDTFTTPGSARDHFGFDPSADPACRIKIGAERGLVMALRKAEKDAADAWALISSESTEAGRAYYAQMTRHSEQLRTVEEAGYEKGLADGRALAEPTPAQSDVVELCDHLTAWLKQEYVARSQDAALDPEVSGLYLTTATALRTLQAERDELRVGILAEKYSINLGDDTNDLRVYGDKGAIRAAQVLWERFADMADYQLERDEAYARALAAETALADERRKVGETGWLIEQPIGAHGGALWLKANPTGVREWREDSHPGKHMPREMILKTAWTKDSNEALRFARKEDAEAFKAMVDLWDWLVVTEHEWPEALSRTAQPTTNEGREVAK